MSSTTTAPPRNSAPARADNDTLTRLAIHKRRVLLTGPPGCGKTARVEAIAAAVGRELISMRVSLSERPDFAGCLVPDMKAGITKALPLDLLHRLRTTTDDIMLFLDDLGQGPIDVQSALMSMFDDGALSKHVLIWGATNRPGDVAGVTRLSEPLRSRFHKKFAIATQNTEVDRADGAVVLGTWGEELAGWCNWAMDRVDKITGLPAPAAPEIIAWHRSTSGRTLYKWEPHADPGVAMPDYRAWEVVMDDWNDGLRDFPTIASTLGKPVAAEFIAFARLADSLPTPDQVWMDPLGAPVPDNDDKSGLYLTASMLGAAAVPQYVTPLLQYLGRMPRVYGALLGRDTYRRAKRDGWGTKLSGNPEWVRWYTANSELFAVGS
jgi:hypothetical protein